MLLSEALEERNKGEEGSYLLHTTARGGFLKETDAGDRQDWSALMLMLFLGR